MDEMVQILYILHKYVPSKTITQLVEEESTLCSFIFRLEVISFLRQEFVGVRRCEVSAEMP